MLQVSGEDEDGTCTGTGFKTALTIPVGVCHMVYTKDTSDDDFGEDILTSSSPHPQSPHLIRHLILSSSSPYSSPHPQLILTVMIVGAWSGVAIYEPSTRWLYNIDQPEQLVPFLEVTDLLKVRKTRQRSTCSGSSQLCAPGSMAASLSAGLTAVICVGLIDGWVR